MALEKKLKNLNLSEKDYQELLEIYKKLGKILNLEKEKISTSLSSLYGVWKGAKIEEKDFERAKKSLFKTSS